MLPEAKSLRWLVNQFPLTTPAKDDTDKICNAIHLYAKAGADKLDQLEKQNAAMTEALKNYLLSVNLCLLCRHSDQCDKEAENEDDKTTRYWRCMKGEEFEFKEVE